MICNVKMDGEVIFSGTKGECNKVVENSIHNYLFIMDINKRQENYSEIESEIRGKFEIEKVAAQGSKKLGECVMRKLEEFCDCSDMELEDKEAKELIINNWIEFGEEKKLALWDYFGQNEYMIEEIDCLEIDTDEVSVNGQSLLVLTDDEADRAYEKYLQNYIDECVLIDIPERYHSYFNEEKFIDDAKMEKGRGDLADFDGYENGPFWKIKGYEFKENIYIYRMK